MSGRKFLVAEFATPADIVKAAGKVHEAGYKKWDAHTPFPVHGLDRAMNIPVSKLGWFVFPCGLTGCLSGLALQWWAAAGSYPLIIAGKPFFSYQAFVPVCFALTILFSAFGTLIGMFVLNGLPALGHPLIAHPGLRRATDDRFLISVDSLDPKFDATRTAELLDRLGGKRITLLEG